jgi:hypothetical protein
VVDALREAQRHISENGAAGKVTRRREVLRRMAGEKAAMPSQAQQIEESVGSTSRKSTGLSSNYAVEFTPILPMLDISWHLWL